MCHRVTTPPLLIRPDAAKGAGSLYTVTMCDRDKKQDEAWNQVRSRPDKATVNPRPAFTHPPGSGPT